MYTDIRAVNLLYSVSFTSHSLPLLVIMACSKDNGLYSKWIKYIVTLCIIIFVTEVVYWASTSVSYFSTERKQSVTAGYTSLSPTTSAFHKEHWLPDWYNQTDIGLLLYRRVREVKHRCAEYEGERNKWKVKPRVKLAHSKNLEYCYTAKAGSTFWGHLLEASKKAEPRFRGRHGPSMVSMLDDFSNCTTLTKQIYYSNHYIIRIECA